MNEEYDKDEYDYCYECIGLGFGRGYVDEKIELNNNNNTDSCDNCEK